NDTTANFLYVNDGTGKLTEVAQLHGAAASASGRMDGSMGVDVCDFNADGEPDLWIANFEAEDFALYHNVGEARYEHYSRRAGISALGTNQVAFGTQCGDFDLDGDEDILVVNGHTSLFPARSQRRQRPMLIANDSHRFQAVLPPADSFLNTPRLGRGLAMGDLDGDGDLDAAVSYLEERVSVLRCDQETANHWLAVRLIGVQTNRDAIGTRVTLHTDRGQQHAQRAGGRSYLSSPEPLLRFGIPARDIVRSITIHWPCGSDQEVIPQGLDRVLTVVEPMP
ncbi:MAG: CRTAC1 family protein, partial [Pirellulaceae bacterium]